VLVGGYSYPGVSSVRYVQQKGNAREKGKLITSARNRSLSRLWKRISCDAELVVGFVNRDIPIAQNAGKTEINRPIESGKDGITEKPQNM
jgi:hypothetical protein